MASGQGEARGKVAGLRLLSQAGELVDDAPAGLDIALASDSLLELALRRCRSCDPSVKIRDSLLEDFQPRVLSGLVFPFDGCDCRESSNRNAARAVEPQYFQVIDNVCVVLPDTAESLRGWYDPHRLVVADSRCRDACRLSDLSDGHMRIRPLDFECTLTITIVCVMQKIPLSSLPTLAIVSIGASLLFLWVAFEQQVIEPFGIYHFMPFYRVAGFCVYDAAAITTISIVLWRLSRTPA